MTIQEQVNADLKEAMKANAARQSAPETIVINLLRVVIGEFNRIDKVINDTQAIAVIKKMIEGNKEIMKGLIEKNGPGLFDSPENAKLLWENSVLSEYMPKQLTEDQLNMHISQIMEELNTNSMKDMGKIMAELKRSFNGQYDGKLASDLIKKKLV